MIYNNISTVSYGHAALTRWKFFDGDGVRIERDERRVHGQRAA